MKRFVSSPPNGGLPLVSRDLEEILQQSHIKSYGKHLDAINDVRLDGYDRLLDATSYDRGIIVSGCKVVTTSPMVMDFTNSMIYLPGLTSTGDFLEPATGLDSNYSIASDTFWMCATSSYETREFKTGGTWEVTEKKTFYVTTVNPGNVPHVKFTSGKTRRNYERLLKYAMTSIDEVMITGNIDDFDNNGVGQGDMWGYVLCDGTNYHPYITVQTYNMRGRFVMGYDYTKQADSQSNTDTTPESIRFAPESPLNGGNYIFEVQEINKRNVTPENYGVVGNIGGGRKDYFLGQEYYFPSVGLKRTNMGRHQHTGRSPQSEDELYHTHPLNRSYGNGYIYNDIGLGFMGGARSGEIWDRSYGLDADGLSRLRTHKHIVGVTGGNEPHESRPPYVVLAYYQKI
jgi:hypothetical protein